MIVCDGESLIFVQDGSIYVNFIGTPYLQNLNLQRILKQSLNSWYIEANLYKFCWKNDSPPENDAKEVLFIHTVGH